MRILIKTIGLLIIISMCIAVNAAEQKTVHGRLELVEDNLFIIEKPEKSKITYLLLGEHVESLKARSGVMVKISGEAEMESKSRGILTITEYKVLSQPLTVEGPIPVEDLIAFAAVKGDRKGVYLIKPDGSEITKISSVNGDYTNILWSHDGGVVLYDYKNDLNEKSVLYTVDISSKRARPYQPVLPKPVIEPSKTDYSPDGTRLLINTQKDGKKQILYKDLLTGDEKKLSDGKGNDSHPIWSKDGSQIAFLSDRSGKNQIYVMDVDNKRIKHIETDFPVYGGIDWTHDQKHVTCIFEKAVHLVSISGGKALKLTEEEYECYEVNSGP